MKIQRYVAPDMRNAMNLIKKEQGPDAVILSNRKVHNGIEVITALDYDEELMKRAFGEKRQSSEKTSQTSRQEIDRENLSKTPAQRQSSDTPVKKTRVTKQAKDNQPAAKMAWSQDPALVSMRQELKSMKQTLEQHLESVKWNEVSHANPHANKVLENLKLMGIDAQLAIEVVAQLPESMPTNTAPTEALRQALLILADMIPVDDTPLDMEGIVAFVGPTGVGKTATISKLAARYTPIYGSHNIALVSTDDAKIGAYEQLKIFGQIFGIPVYKACGDRELKQLLGQLNKKRLILIDTQGFCQNNTALPRQLASLSKLGSRITTYLTLSADMQPLMMAEAISVYRNFLLSGVIFTKLDEAVEYGSFLSVVINHHLPLIQISDGQQVPDSLKNIDARHLVSRMVKRAKQRSAARTQAFA